MASRREDIMAIADELPDKHRRAFLWLVRALLKERKAMRGASFGFDLEEVPDLVPRRAKISDGRLRYVARTYTQELAEAVGYKAGEYHGGQQLVSGRPAFGGGSRQVAGAPGGYEYFRR